MIQRWMEPTERQRRALYVREQRVRVWRHRAEIAKRVVMEDYGERHLLHDYNYQRALKMLTRAEVALTAKLTGASSTRRSLLYKPEIMNDAEKHKVVITLLEKSLADRRRQVAYAQERLAMTEAKLAALRNGITTT